MIKKKTILSALILIVAGIILGQLSAPLKPTTSRATPLINPTVTSNLNKHFIINFQPLKAQLLRVQNGYHQKTYIYFSYLNNASWIGLNEKEDFTAASTIKIPLAMAVFKAAEERKLKLTDSYSFASLGLDPGNSAMARLGINKQFTIEELVKIMLQTSDNMAAVVLNNIFKRVGIDSPLVDVYNAMGWPNVSMPTILTSGVLNYQKINLKTLSNMFLALYDASYINIPHSEELLDLLTSRLDVNANKIVASLPENISFANKVGRSVVDNTFSDCGIVYVPNRHYLLCVGSSGADEDSANQFMADVSRAVYQYVINY